MDQSIREGAVGAEPKLGGMTIRGRHFAREELLRLAMKDVGFERLKRRIRARLNRGIGGLIRGGSLASDGDFVWRAK